MHQAGNQIGFWEFLDSICKSAKTNMRPQILSALTRNSLCCWTKLEGNKKCMTSLLIRKMNSIKTYLPNSIRGQFLKLKPLWSQHTSSRRSNLRKRKTLLTKLSWQKIWTTQFSHPSELLASKTMSSPIHSKSSTIDLHPFQWIVELLNRILMCLRTQNVFVKSTIKRITNYMSSKRSMKSLMGRTLGSQNSKPV